MRRHSVLVLSLVMALVCAGGLLACSKAGPSPELLSAREAYAKAEESRANELVPDQLLTAKQALDLAETRHQDEGPSHGARTRAYIAERKAQLAIVSAETIAAKKAIAKADQLYAAELEKKHSSASRRLGKTESALERARQNLERQETELSAKDQELRRRADELKAREAELVTEREARKEAEDKAAAALASLEEVARVKEEKRGMVITLSGAVLFKSGARELLPIAERQLTKVADALKEQDESKTIVVEGHTDSRGSDATNLRLSQARAEAVRYFLVSQGVASQRIRAVGRGERDPIASNRSADGRANNRRVEIVVSP